MIAVDMVKKIKPDVLITDVLMAGVSGSTLVKEVRSLPEGKNLKIIMMSASPKIEEIAREAGVDSFISKPFDISDLLDKISASGN